MTQQDQNVDELLALKSIFEKFIDRQILTDQVSKPLTTDGKIKDICVMFTDVRGFTKFSEKSGLQATNSFLNNYYDIVIEHIHHFGGVMDKFLGDGTMAVFGAFEDEGDYVQRCVKASNEILKDFTMMTKQKDEPNLFLGIGINAGPAIIGTFGNGNFVDFTAIGHTVNLAARVQGIASDNKIYVTKEVTEQVKGISFRSRGYFHLKNITKPVELFEVIQAA